MSTITTTLGDIDVEVIPNRTHNAAVAAWRSTALTTESSGPVPRAEGFAVLRGDSFTHNRRNWDGVTSNHGQATRDEIAAAVEAALETEVPRAREIVRRARRAEHLEKAAALRARADAAFAAADESEESEE